MLSLSLCHRSACCMNRLLVSELLLLRRGLRSLRRCRSDRSLTHLPKRSRDQDGPENPKLGEKRMTAATNGAGERNTSKQMAGPTPTLCD
mmetsp:Transcript_50737/g.105614  ORF Transcript_50737/g.105614 Transcript_50737/m.105614 type:complete len:90 (-) Transcript_50737:3-272(-)